MEDITLILELVIKFHKLFLSNPYGILALAGFYIPLTIKLIRKISARNIY